MSENTIETVFFRQVVASVDKDLSSEYIDELIKNFDLYKPAVCIGHPEDDSPAYGWVGKLFRVNDDLEAEMEVLPEFYEQLKKGIFKRRSIAYFEDFNKDKTNVKVMAHVAFLGGAPPKIKGMPDSMWQLVRPRNTKSENELIKVEFSNDSKITKVTYSEDEEIEWKFSTIANVFQKLREWFIQEFGVEEADKIISSWTIDDLKQRMEGVSEFSELLEKTEVNDMPDEKDKEKDKAKFTDKQVESLVESAVKKEEVRLRAEFSETETKLKKALTDKETELTTAFDKEKKVLSDEIETLKTKNQELTTKLDELSKEVEKGKIETLCDQLISDPKGARMQPTEKESTVNLYMQLPEATRETFMENLKNRPVIMKFGEDPDAAKGGGDVPKGEKLNKNEEGVFEISEEDEKKYGGNV